ncbi:hypothetical protein KA001_00720, partial [Patescibacteria group bacterium]|nr:hypothetical protein [Patescibacteria group bacterium]
LPYLVKQLPKSFGGGFEVIDRAEPNIIDVESAVDLMGVSDLTKKEETVWSFIIQAAGNPIRTRTLARILDIEPTEVRKIIQSLSVKVHAQKPNYNLVGAKTMPAGKTLAYKIEKLAPNTTAQEEAKKKLKLEDVFKIIESEHVEYPTITIKNGDEVFSAFGDLAKIILFLKNNNLINLQEGQITTRVDYKWLSQNRGSLFDERNGQLNLGEKFRVIFNSALTAGAHPFLQFSSTGKGLAVEYTVTFSEGTEILITLKEKTLVQKAWEYATKHNSGKPTVGHLLRDVQIVDRNIRATAQAEDPQFVECRSLQVLLGDKDIDELSLKIAELLLSKRSKPSSTVPCEGPYFDDIKQVWKIKHTDVQQYFGRFNANNSTLKGRKTGAKSSGTSVFTIAQAFETLFRTSDLNLSHTQQELLVEKVLENLNILR